MWFTMKQDEKLRVFFVKNPNFWHLLVIFEHTQEYKTISKYSLIFTWGFRAIYRIGLMHTDILTVIVGTIDSIGPITLKIKNIKNQVGCLSLLDLTINKC